MKLLFLTTLIVSTTGLNLEFNSKQFPSWIKTPLTYSSFIAPQDIDIENLEENSVKSSCVFFEPKDDQQTNESYIFESKCYRNSHCEYEDERSKDSSTVLPGNICDKINGTINKVGAFSIAEYDYRAKKIVYYVYMIIEGCCSINRGYNRPFSWILNNDTKYIHRILKNYQLKLPLNDNQLYFGEMTFDDGDNDCSNLCSEIVCEKSLELKIVRDVNGSVTASDLGDLEEGTTISTTMVAGLSIEMIQYLPIVVGVILIVVVIGYFVYQTKCIKK